MKTILFFTGYTGMWFLAGVVLEIVVKLVG